MSEWTKITLTVEDETVRVVVPGPCECPNNVCVGHVCDRCWVQDCSHDLLLEEVTHLVNEGETKNLLAKYIDTSAEGPEGMEYDGHLELKLDDHAENQAAIANVKRVFEAKIINKIRGLE